MSNYGEKIKAAEAYIHTVYCIEDLADGGIFGMYGLEQQRIAAHEKLCELLKIDHVESKEICLRLDKSIGYDRNELDLDYDFYLEKYAKKLVVELGRLRGGE